VRTPSNPNTCSTRARHADADAHMVAINAALGFEIHQVYGDLQKQL
jgi:hypothetical protein